VALGQTSVSFSLVNGLYINDGGGETLTVSNNVDIRMHPVTSLYLIRRCFQMIRQLITVDPKSPLLWQIICQKANGERLKFFYKAWPHNGIDEVMSMVRLQSVSSSFGYLIKIEYNGNYDDPNTARTGIRYENIINKFFC
jgi:hypothetical protein